MLICLQDAKGMKNACIENSRASKTFMLKQLPGTYSNRMKSMSP